MVLRTYSTSLQRDPEWVLLSNLSIEMLGLLFWNWYYFQRTDTFPRSRGRVDVECPRPRKLSLRAEEKIIRIGFAAYQPETVLGTWSLEVASEQVR